MTAGLIALLLIVAIFVVVAIVLWTIPDDPIVIEPLTDDDVP